jgi:protein-S-isoprenylcysteine O-methyltransferase Ste14
MILFLKNLLFTLLLPGSIALWIPFYLTRNMSIHSGFSQIAAIMFFVIGGIIYLWCLWDFATFGRGTPAPIDAPKKLVVRGLYQYVRNPMYVGVLTVILGWSILYHSVTLLLYAFCVAVGFNLFILLYEEPHLRTIFGNQYDEYCKKAGRWFPKLR